MITLIGSVGVFVEMEDGEVRRVIVDDENFEFSNAGTEDGQVLSKKAVTRAIAQAENGQAWPPWEFGW